MPAKPGTPTISTRSSQKLLLIGSLLAIALSAGWICYYELRTSDVNVQLQRTVGQVLAQETVRVTGRPAKIVVVTVNTPAAPELKVQLDAFQKDLKRFGNIAITDKVVLDAGDNPKYRAGAGLSAKHLLKIIRKHATADAIVSFVGIPELSDQDLAQVKPVPKLVAETHSPEKLVKLLDNKVLLSAVVPRFEFPAPGPRKPHTPREWFDRNFQVITSDSHLAAVVEESP